MHGCIKDDSGELLKHALKKRCLSLWCLLNGIVSLHFTLPHPPSLRPLISFSPRDERKYNKYTVAYTYGADELVYTVLCHAVHMCEMLLKVYVREFSLAQRALDSLKTLGGGT